MRPLKSIHHRRAALVASQSLFGSVNCRGAGFANPSDLRIGVSFVHELKNSPPLCERLALLLAEKEVKKKMHLPPPTKLIERCEKLVQ